MSTANNQHPESVSLNAFKQPKAFYLIFSIELWERFGYYGLQGIMAVYLVKMLGMSEADSITLFSSFSALVYGFVAIGGWLGDKVLGAKRVIVLGALVLAAKAAQQADAPAAAEPAPAAAEEDPRKAAVAAAIARAKAKKAARESLTAETEDK